MNTKLSLAELKAKAKAVNTADALNAIKGGKEQYCHNGYGKPTIKKEYPKPAYPIPS